MKYRVLILCSLAMLVSCAGAPTSQTAPTPTPKPVQAALEKPTYTVQRGTVLDQLQLSGRVAAIQQQDLSFTQDGYLQALYVDRTSVITAGQILAQLDLGDLPTQLRQAQVNLEQAALARDRNKTQLEFTARRAKLDLEEARARLAELEAPADANAVAKAQAEVQKAQIALNQVRDNASAAKTNAQIALDQATNALTQAQSTYSTAMQNWQHVQETGTDPIQPTKVENNKNKPNTLNDAQRQQYYDAYIQATAALRTAETSVAQAQVAYDTARQNEALDVQKAEADVVIAQSQLNDLTRGPLPSEVADARRSVARAQVTLDEAAQGADPKLERDVASAQLDVERIQAQIDAGILRAPFDGKIAAIDGKPGDAVKAYKPFISVMNESALEVVVDFIGTEDSTKVGVGQHLDITFTRYKGQTVSGTVTRLPTKLTSSSSTVDSDPSFHISYDAPDLDLDVGDLAQLVLTLSRKDDALWLPPQAVRSFEGRRFVVIKDGDRQRRQDVKVGIISTDRIELLDGVKEGDVVVGQ